MRDRISSAHRFLRNVQARSLHLEMAELSTRILSIAAARLVSSIAAEALVRHLDKTERTWKSFLALSNWIVVVYNITSASFKAVYN